MLNLDTIRPNQVNFGEKNWEFRVQKYKTTSHHISNLLKIFQSLKNLIKSWDGVFCQCNLCKIFEKWGPCFLCLCLLHTHKHSFTICKLLNNVRVGFDYFNMYIILPNLTKIYKKYKNKKYIKNSHLSNKDVSRKCFGAFWRFGIQNSDPKLMKKLNWNS